MFIEKERAELSLDRQMGRRGIDVGIDIGADLQGD